MPDNQTATLLDISDTTWEIKKHSSIVQMNNVTTQLERKILNSMIWIAKDALKREPDQRIFTCDL